MTNMLSSMHQNKGEIGMKKFKVKVFLISMILLITGGITGVSLADGAATLDEFAELESSYESTSPKLNAAELSSTFTSEKEIEVYLETSRNDIDKSLYLHGLAEHTLNSKQLKMPHMMPQEKSIP